MNPNGEHQFLVEVKPGAAAGKVAGGFWRLRLRNPGAADVRVDAWSLVEGDAADAAFQPPEESNDLKVGSPGATASVVTVASFTTRIQWVDADGVARAVGLLHNMISEFSSPGPTRRGQKPDVTAPGAMLVSCRSTGASPDPPLVIGPAFVVDGGTSMACPFVAGLVALLLQQDATLTPAQVKALLVAASSTPGLGSGVFHRRWGFGLIDAALL
jgi:subtilisin family serine protease